VSLDETTLLDTLLTLFMLLFWEDRIFLKCNSLSAQSATFPVIPSRWLSSRSTYSSTSTKALATMPSINRLYVDLIYQGSDKYANYDPPSGPLEVGAYGIVTRDGGFLVHGNIYSDEFKESYKPDVSILSPIKRANEECMKFQSSYVRSLEAAVQANTCVVTSIER
jgi:hypothetical protein